MSNPEVVIIVAHGSRVEESSTRFLSLVQRVGARCPGREVAGAFMSINSPSVLEAAASAAANGAKTVRIIPYFLHGGSHYTNDFPELALKITEQFPDVSVILGSKMENDPLLEDLLVERVGEPLVPYDRLPVLGGDIEKKSHEIIDRRLECVDCDVATKAVMRRVIHATADFSYAETLRIHPEAVARGVEALRDKRPVICDSTILKSGVTRTNSEVLCAIRDEDVIALAKEKGMTRATAAMEKMSGMMDGAV
ncbi:MAG: precorrin-8X methylmutase, partial [Planctomycetes bacterium]|nr:precorrin-8X methylmutase [Planctomycetota bacterium]